MSEFKTTNPLNGLLMNDLLTCWWPMMVMLLVSSSMYPAKKYVDKFDRSNLEETEWESNSTTAKINAIQQWVISGTVVDNQGLPLPGASIVEKGTTNGTVTDFDGNFTLTVADDNAVLSVSYVGFETKEIAIDGRETLNIILEEDAAALEEVVVIGYGTQQKSDLTGSVARIDAETFETQPMTQVTDMLRGTVAGLDANQNASAAGGSSIEIRGRNSLSAGTSPLIVVDGVIYHGDLADINPNDVEAIDILKDASSAAVYGSRAANGVIIVTTKKGAMGAPTINFSSEVGISEATKDREPLNAEEFLAFRSDYFSEGALGNPSIPENFYTNPNMLPPDVDVQEWLNYNTDPNPDPYTEYLQRVNLYPTELENALAGETVDWYPLVMNEEALSQDYDFSIGGGTENTRYYWSLGYTDNEGIIRGDEYSAIQSRLNLDFEIRDWLSVGANTQFSSRDESAVPASLGLMYISSPFGEVYNEDGTLNLRPSDDPSAYNPLMNYYGQERERKIYTLFSNLYANVGLPFEINYQLSFQPRFSFTTDRNFWGEQTITGTQTYPGGYGTRSNFQTKGWMLDNLFTWNKTIGIHGFDVTFLYNVEMYRSWYEHQDNQNFAPNLNLGFHGLQYGDNPSITNLDTKETGDALMGRLNYSLLDKYLVTASLRRDGYSAFGQESPRALFPAAAFAWKISEENFFDENWVVNRLKLRLSWGVNGNREIGAYSALAQLGSVLDYDGSNVLVGVENRTLSNPGLVWEKTQSFNVGFDFGLLNDRIDISANYYIGTTIDMLMNRQLPSITGFQSITTNLGELENRGLELSMRTRNMTSQDFNWTSDFVFSLNRNKIISLFGDTGEYMLLGETHRGEVPDFSNQWFPGQAVDVVWDYDVAGVWQMEEADAAAEYNMAPGDFRAVDVNEDGEYTDLIDKKFIGHTTPRYRLGLRNDFSYKNFSASIFIRGDLGHILPFPIALQGSLSHDRRNYSGGPLPYWTPENRNNEYARLRPIHSAYGGGLGIYKPASFVRIQNLSLGYTIPTATADRLKLNSMRIFGAIRNLHSFDKWPGWDPESNMTPMPRTLTIGLDLSL